MIWYQSSGAIGKDQKYLAYETTLRKHVQEISTSKLTWIFKGVDPSEAPSEKYKSIDDLRKEHFIRNALKAKSEGFVGFAVGCWQDHGYQEIRRNKNIQVVSIAEATLHLMMMVGQHPGLIVLSKKDEDLIKNNMTYYGISTNCFKFEVCSLDIEFLSSAFDDPSQFTRAIKSAVEKLLTRKTDVLAFGCGIFNEILYKHKSLAFVEIPVIDCVSVLVKTMEMLLECRVKMEEYGFEV